MPLDRSILSILAFCEHHGVPAVTLDGPGPAEHHDDRRSHAGWATGAELYDLTADAAQSQSAVWGAHAFHPPTTTACD